ncbi:MAG: cytochrome c [Psychromonas sp.]
MNTIDCGWRYGLGINEEAIVYLSFYYGDFMKKLCIVSLMLMSPGFLFAAGDVGAGKAKSMICASCHGAEGISIAPIYPNLNGQKAPYLIGALKAYKAGQRKGGMAMIMIPQAKALSDTDMADLAAYYSSMK